MSELYDGLNPYLITDRLPVSIIGTDIDYYDTLSSTNDVAREKARNGVAEGLVVLAGEQTKSRGRHQREWKSPSGNIALSVVLYPDVKRLSYLVMMAALSVCRAVEDITGLKPEIKWPNDVLVHGRKVCGILIENELKNGACAAVVGIGINVRINPADYQDIAGTATSLENEAGRDISRVDMVRNLLVNLDALYNRADDSDTFIEWREKLVTLGKPVSVMWNDTRLDGIAESVDESGVLEIRTQDGTLHTVIAGDVTLRQSTSGK